MNEQGWIEHDGGECPVAPDTVVNWRIADRDDADDDQTVTADQLLWEHHGFETDIMAYRIVEPGK